MDKQEKLILYVDDDADDRQFLSEAIHSVNPKIEVKLAENGLQALDYLRSAKESQLPCLIVLDINMPFLDGKEVFQQIKKDVKLQSVPVMIFSSSEKPADKAMFNSLGAEYFTKPSHLSHLSSIAIHMLSVCEKV